MDRKEALEELKLRMTNENLIKHSLAVEAIMRELAIYFKEDAESWGLAGLLHDIDYDKTVADFTKHSIVGAEILENMGVDGSIVYAVKSHNSHHGIKRKRKMDKALYAADPLSGLIIASVLVLPSKKIKDATVDFIKNRFNENGFARNANREQINEYKEIGLEFEKFIEIAIKAMQNIAEDLGL